MLKELLKTRHWHCLSWLSINELTLCKWLRAVPSSVAFRPVIVTTKFVCFFLCCVRPVSTFNGKSFEYKLTNFLLWQYKSAHAAFSLFAFPVFLLSVCLCVKNELISRWTDPTSAISRYICRALPMAQKRTSFSDAKSNTEWTYYSVTHQSKQVHD